MTKRKAGAPMGGRVHWFIMFLPREFKRTYQLRFDYEYHNYHFTRYDKRTPIDEFIIIRTSRNCFRCMYFHFEWNYFEYFSEETAREAAEHVIAVYNKVRASEERARGLNDK